MSNVPSVSQSAAAELPFPQQSPKINKIEKIQQNNKNNDKKITNPSLNLQDFTKVSIMHLFKISKSKVLKNASYGTPIKKLDVAGLKLNNKNEELISKENKDRFTDFNSIKQLDKKLSENNVSAAVIDMDLVSKLADNN
ncbi:hypothetical protein BB561_006814, partial [Smittium simulii]